MFILQNELFKNFFQALFNHHLYSAKNCEKVKLKNKIFLVKNEGNFTEIIMKIEEIYFK